MKTIENHIGKKRTTIAKAIRDEAKAIETIKAEVVAVQNAHSDNTGTTLQVKGVSGMSKEEAEKAWKERRVIVMTKWNEAAAEGRLRRSGILGGAGTGCDARVQEGETASSFSNHILARSPRT